MDPNSNLEQKVKEAATQIAHVIENVERVIKGKKEVVKKVMIALAADGHILLHDVPGVGKTMLAKSIAKSIDLQFKRVQFTPDLLPSDITGVNIYNQETRKFEFNTGPVFTNILLGDEINRASPKTQSALLEAMEERQVTVDNHTYKLDKPFLVIATQNPVEHDGTYPLPAAQLDRFLMRLELGYPDKQTELEILDINKSTTKPIDTISPVMTGQDILNWQETSSQVFVSNEIKNYIVNIARATREDAGSKIGVSPRSTILLMKASQATALLSGRTYVIPDDVIFIVREVFGHRLTEAGNVGFMMIEEIINKIPIN